MNCPRCGNLTAEGSAFCTKCGAQLSSAPSSQFLIVTTPTVAGYKIKRVLGLVTGLTPRTRGLLGQFVAGWESMVGGEVTAFTSEVEKARWEAIERAKSRAIALGANAIIGLDVETSSMGAQNGAIMLFSATGTAVVIEPETVQV
ncbi:MAG TPA: heavy metal-binding domain-containing protein [Candidatus Acidoferrales bacterium]|nr:heavy metal-binding domain-containing protein [Candidatus Acidoferrales bacterium]